MTAAAIRAQAATMIRFLDQRRCAGLLSAEEYIISIGEIERWAIKAIANKQTFGADEQNLIPASRNI